MHATRFEHRMDTRTSIDLAMIQKNLLDFGCKLGIFSTVLGSLPAFPGIIAALGNLKRFAEQRDRVLLAVLCNELKFHTWPREKMPIAFFRMSRSCRSRSFSRGPVAKLLFLRGLMSTGRQMPARPAGKTAGTSARAVLSAIPRSRAIWAC